MHAEIWYLSTGRRGGVNRDGIDTKVQTAETKA